MLRKPLAAGRARLACINWVYSNDYTPSLCRFGVKPVHEVPPACIHDALGQMTVPHHVLDPKLLDGDEGVPLN